MSILIAVIPGQIAPVFDLTTVTPILLMALLAGIAWIIPQVARGRQWCGLRGPQRPSPGRRTSNVACATARKHGVQPSFSSEIRPATRRRGMSDRQYAYVQARRFEHLFEKAARAYLTALHTETDTPREARAVEAGRALTQAAELADAWAARAVLPGRASPGRIPRSVLAARVQEHPTLFDPLMRPPGAALRRIREVSRSIEGMARAIGDHLASLPIRPSGPKPRQGVTSAQPSSPSSRAISRESRGSRRP